MKTTIEATIIHDEDFGEAYYLIPSGYKGVTILVNDSPTDLSVRYEDTDTVEDVVTKLLERSK